MARIIFAVVLLFYSMSVFGQNAKLPAAIQVGEKSKLILRTYATGVQVYVCQQNAKDPSRYSWVFKEPHATLYTDAAHRHNIGKHYFDEANSPTWKNGDGSKACGAKVAQANGPDSAAIPWLLLKSTSTTGSGVLMPTSFIQRINTKGGKAPAKAERPQAGKMLEVPYEAEYLFYSGK